MLKVDHKRVLLSHDSCTVGPSTSLEQLGITTVDIIGTCVCVCVTGDHWPFSVHFSKMADQNIKQDALK